MDIGVGIILSSCNILAMSAVGTEPRLIQMIFNIPVALGVALAKPVIGALTASKIAAGFDQPELRQVSV